MDSQKNCCILFCLFLTALSLPSDLSLRPNVEQNNSLDAPTLTIKRNNSKLIQALTKKPSTKQLERLANLQTASRLWTKLKNRKDGTSSPSMSQVLSKVLSIASTHAKNNFENDLSLSKLKPGAFGDSDDEGLVLEDNFLDEKDKPKNRVKRFTCWHSCLGPWKKRSPKSKTSSYSLLLGLAPSKQDSEQMEFDETETKDKAKKAESTTENKSSDSETTASPNEENEEGADADAEEQDGNKLDQDDYLGK